MVCSIDFALRKFATIICLSVLRCLDCCGFVIFCSCPPELCNATQCLLLISLDTLIPPCFSSIFEMFFPLYPQQHEPPLELFASEMQVHLFNVVLVQALNLDTFSPNYFTPLHVRYCYIYQKHIRHSLSQHAVSVSHCFCWSSVIKSF